MFGVDVYQCKCCKIRILYRYEDGHSSRFQVAILSVPSSVRTVNEAHLGNTRETLSSTGKESSCSISNSRGSDEPTEARESLNFLNLFSLPRMTEPTTPQSPKRFKAPDSPLGPSHKEPKKYSPLSSTSNPSGFSTTDTTDQYDSDEDLVASVAQPTITKGSHRRESSTAALLSDPLEAPPSPRTRQRQRRLRDYERDDESGSGPLASLKRFIDRNSGELNCVSS